MLRKNLNVAARTLRRAREHVLRVAPVLGVRYVACDCDDALEPGDGLLERIFATGVDDEPPTPVRERSHEGEAEASRRAGDDSHSCSHLSINYKLK